MSYKKCKGGFRRDYGTAIRRPFCASRFRRYAFLRVNPLVEVALLNFFLDLLPDLLPEVLPDLLPDFFFNDTLVDLLLELFLDFRDTGVECFTDVESVSMI